MILYWSILSILIVLALSEILFRKKNISFLASGLMMLFAGFRYYTGFDFTSYQDFYEKAASLRAILGNDIDAEKGYLFINHLFSSLGLNFYTFIFFFAICSVGLLEIFLYKYTPFPTTFLTYYYARFFLVRDMGQIRSALACIILLYAIPYIVKRKPIHFLMVVFIASLFHITAWFFVLAYLFNKMIKDIHFQVIFVLLIIALIVGVIVQIPQLYSWAIPGRYIAYFTNPAYTNGEWIKNPILWMQLGIFFGSFICYRPESLKKKEQFEVILKTYLLASLALVAAGNLGTVGGRISTLFATTEILIVPYFILNIFKNKVINLFMYFGFVLVIFVLIFIISGTYNQYIPYDTIFGI